MYSFSYLEPVVVPCPVLTVVSWPAYRFLKRQVRWSGIPISLKIFQFVASHTVKGFRVVNEAEVYVFLEFSSFFYDPKDVGNLISDSSAFSKSAWTSGHSQFVCCWSPAWRILSITLLVCKMSAVVYTFVGTAFLWDWNENWPFLVLWPLLSVPNLLAYWVQHFHSIIFQDLK